MRLGVVAAACFLAACPARADVPDGTPGLRGVALSVPPDVLRVRRQDGEQIEATLLQDATVVVAHPLPRAALAIGEPVAVNADEIAMPEGRLLIVGIYLQADPSVAPASREALARMYLPASGPDPEPHILVSGRLVSLEGTWLTIQDGTEVIRVKLLPEARGLLVRFGQMSDLREGATVTVTLPPGGAKAVLVEE